MKTVNNIIQNSEDWLKLRTERIGASDANIIMGVSKFSTPSKLLAEKISQEIVKKDDKNTFITDKGHRLEVKIRAMVELDTFLEFPAVVALSEKYPFLMASLDGYNDETKTVLECKFVGAEDFEKVKSGKVLDQYYPQLQHQMLVTGAQKNILAVAKTIKATKNPDGIIKEKEQIHYASMEVIFDQPYVVTKLLPALEKFWAEVLKGRSGEKAEVELIKGDSLDMTDNMELHDLLDEYRVLCDEMDTISGHASKIKENIFALVEHDKVICGKATIKTVRKKGSVTIDYKKYCTDQKLEIPETYTKTGKPSESKQISFEKQ